MARSGYGGGGNYGRVGGRRPGGAGALQWLIIGGTLGFGCAAIFVLGLLTLGVLAIDDGDPETVVIQATVQTLPTVPTADVQGTVQAIVDATALAQPTNTEVPPSATSAPASQGIVAPSPTQLQAPQTEATTGAADTTDGAADDADAQQPLPTATQLQQATTVASDTPASDAGAQAPSGNSSTGATDLTIPPELSTVMSDMVAVDGGLYTMGTTVEEIAIAVRECIDRDGGICQESYGDDSRPQVQVNIDPFEIEETEVTNAQYVAFLNWMGPGSHANGCSGQLCVEVSTTDANSPITFDSLNYDVSPAAAVLPVINVTWFGAQAYCEAIGRRLPTEAEWELAARGRTGNRYPWGDEWDVTYARTNRPDPNNVGVVAVRSYNINVSPFGAIDMAGNAAEWVADWYDPNAYRQIQGGAVNPDGPATGVERVVRGGGWDTPPFFSRSVHRQSQPPTETQLWLGFRCAADFQVDTGTSNQGTGTTNSGAGLVPATALPGAGGLPSATPFANAAPTLSLPATATPEEVQVVPPGG